MLLCRIEFPTYGMKMASLVTNSQNIGSLHCHPHSACWSHSCCSKHSSPTQPRKSVPSFSIYLISSTSTTMITCYLVKMSPPTNWFTKQHAHAGWTDCPDCIISKVLGFQFPSRLQHLPGTQLQHTPRTAHCNFPHTIIPARMRNVQFAHKHNYKKEEIWCQVVCCFVGLYIMLCITT